MTDTRHRMLAIAVDSLVRAAAEGTSSSARDVAAHLCAAVQQHRGRLKSEGWSPPPGLVDLELALASEASPVATSRHDGPVFDSMRLPTNDDDVPADGLLTRGQASVRMRCSVSTVDRRIRTGELRSVRNGRLVLLRVVDIDAYLEGSAHAA